MTKKRHITIKKQKIVTVRDIIESKWGLVLFAVVGLVVGFIVGFLVFGVLQERSLPSSLIIGAIFGGIFAGALILGYGIILALMKNNFNEQIRKIAFGGFLIIILVFTFVFGSPYLGEIFGPPGEVPEAQRRGYAKVMIYNAMNNSYLEDVDIYLFDMENQTILATISENETIRLNSSLTTHGYIVKDGYYNLSVSLRGNGDEGTSEDPYINNFTIYKIADPNDIIFQLVRIDGVFGTYNESNITNGFQILEFELVINEPSAYNASYGEWTYVPKVFVPENTYADNWSIFYKTQMIVFNGTVNNLSSGCPSCGYEYNLFKIKDCHILRQYGTQTSTRIGYLLYGNFTDIVDIYMTYGFIDNYNKSQINLKDW
ncbi:MAG: hypothetical protein GF317_06060 [Candidatus Lokiarchaeota archaeon]|nr:hypothetical protein [Candidatus Lokiarchaeota archaeon]